MVWPITDVGVKERIHFRQRTLFSPGDFGFTEYGVLIHCLPVSGASEVHLGSSLYLVSLVSMVIGRSVLVFGT